jgi:hypothetical protein
MAAVDDGAVKPGSPEALEFGRLLRERYKALWQDVQRETEKYRSQLTRATPRWRICSWT